ncbi:hypothetical protein KP509_35G024500 [Ceratopteris richardii]|uniref:F-box domain-containing protein n=1 Tax=Ceratopteris richardii TaxID=49495 RepID=A0A8T2QF24_CERRI|nr:hypothetical protein KP509_35G024500 [Ceratopteris richardii]
MELCRPACAERSPRIPDELARRILCLLPLEALFRLRCVCRRWRSLPFSLLFEDWGLDAACSEHPHVWVFMFRLLARKVNEQYFRSYKCTTYTYETAYDRELMGASGYGDIDMPAQVFPGCYPRKGYRIIYPSGTVAASLERGVIDIVASANGLLLMSLRMSKVHDHEENNLRLFVYNPISKGIRALPKARYAPQKLAVLSYTDGNGTSFYKVYSLGRSYRTGTSNLLYSLEIYDSADACHGWKFMSHVKANLSGRDLHPGTETELMGYLNSKAIANELGFLYWMEGCAEIYSCHLASGFYYSVPALPFKTTFASMWPSTSGLLLACGIAKEDDASCTCGVEIWELLQTEENLLESGENFYGGKCSPQGTCWKPFDKMDHGLWTCLACEGTGRIACLVCLPFLFVVAENEHNHMVVYDTDNRTWKLIQSWPSLWFIFHNNHPGYFKVDPWIVALTPKASAVV